MVNTDILGNGIRFPLVRTASDFQVSSGEDLVFSSLPYVLLTQANGPNIQGEIPWDSSFGSQLLRLKHKNIITDDEILNELARQYIIESLEINEPRILVRDVRVDFIAGVSGNKLDFHVTAALIETDTEANDVRIREDFTVSFDLPI